MDIATVLLSAGAGVITSAVTAYLTSKLTISVEHQKWGRERAVKDAEVVDTKPAFAQDLAKQLAVGYLVIDEPKGVPIGAEGRRKVFIPPNCRLLVGRCSPPADISVRDECASVKHAAISSDSAHVFVEDLDAKNGTWVNLNRLETTCVRLNDGDVVRIGSTRLRLYLLTK
ncbi:MAG: FHA domain-containing protein [Candidatus Korobacteraceae bacterium]